MRATMPLEPVDEPPAEPAPDPAEAPWLTDEQWAAVESGRSEARLRTLSALTPIGIFETDPQGECIWVNARWERIFGVTLSRARGAGWTQVVHPEDRERVKAQWDRAVAAGGESKADLRLLLPDGRVVWVAWRAAPLRDSEGSVRGFLGTVTDVTDRIVAQRALAEGELRYRALVEDSADMVIRTAADGTILYVSPACRSLLGYEPEEIVGRTTSSLVHEGDLGTVATLRGGDGAPATYELRMLHRNGHWVWTEHAVRGLRTADGAVERHGTVRSIEQRRQAEISLRQSLGRYRSLAENFPGGAVFVFDRELRYQVAAGPALVALGIDADVVEGKTPVEAFPGERGARLTPWYRAAIAGSVRQWQEQAPTGRTYDVTIGPVFDEQGGIIAGTAIAVDVTERARAEQEQSALRAISEAVARSASLAEVLELVASKVAVLFRADVASITRFDTSRRGTLLALEPPVAPGPASPSILDLGDRTATGRVSATGEAAFVDGYDPGTTLGAGLRARGLGGGAAAPIRIRGAVWGAIAVAGPEQRWAEPGEIDRLAGFAEIISVAISSAEAWETLSRHAATDGVTGLANHRSFQERLRDEVKRAARYGRRLSVVLFDLDHFKQINDTYGHQTGDRVLGEAARRMTAQTRQGELVARIGGEEFAWILPETDAAGAFEAAERVRRAIEGEPFAGAGLVTVSAGVCSLAESSDAEELMRFADRALYHAKDSGRNITFRYTEDARVELAASETGTLRFQMMSSIRALARAIDAKDYSTREHSERVADLAVALAAELGWTTKSRQLLHTAGLLHDVGKIGVPDHILLKPGRLDDAEFEEIKLHAALGGQIAGDVLEGAQAQWVRSHHERWDGRGYPDRLVGEDIPDGAQVLALADSWDVMTTIRTYKTTRSHDDAIAECRRESGRQFAPGAVAALLRLDARSGFGRSLMDTTPRAA